MIYKAGSWEIFPSRRKFYLILYKFIVSDKSVARPIGGRPPTFQPSVLFYLFYRTQTINDLLYF